MISPRRLEAQRRALSCGPRPAPEKYRIPAEFMARPCSECRTTHITNRNTTGICRSCWQNMSKRKRAAYTAEGK